MNFLALHIFNALLALEVAQKQPGEIEDIRPPIPPDHSLSLTVAIIILLILAVTAYFLWPVLRKTPNPPPLPREEARHSLEGTKGRLSQLAPYLLSIELSAILRRFIEKQYGYRAQRQTTQEFLQEIHQSPRFNPQQQTKLQNFLTLCDQIKFAQFAAAPPESSLLMEQAWSFVEEAE